MKVPKAIKRLCPHCKKHTEHKVTQNKRKQASSLTYGSKVRARRRGSARGVGNKGRYSKPAITKFKRTGAKSSKTLNLKLTCSECSKSIIRTGSRTKKLELE